MPCTPAAPAFALTCARWALAASVALAALPASAWTILAKIEPDGNTLFGPADLAGSGRPNQNKTVTVNYTSAYAPPSNPVVTGPTFDQILGNSLVNIRKGELVGSTHAAGYDHNVLRQIAATGSLSETVTTFSGAGQWVVLTTVFSGSGGTSATGTASSTAIFQASINDTRISASFNSLSGWGTPTYSDSNPNSFAVVVAQSGGWLVELHALIPNNLQLLVEANFRSDSKATGRLSTGVALASQNLQGNLWLTLPSGVGGSSTSGVFLADAGIAPAVPEPESWALMLAGAAATPWRGRRALSTAATR